MRTVALAPSSQQETWEAKLEKPSLVYSWDLESKKINGLLCPSSEV